MRLSGTKTSSVNQYNGLGDQLYDLGGARPTLDLNFSSNESLVDSVTGKTLVDHTRQSSATYVDGDGVIKTAVTNLLLRSEEFNNASWVLTSGSTVTENVTPNPINSLTDADKFAVGTSSFPQIAQSTNTTVANTHTFSAYVKADGVDFVQLRVRNAGATSNYFRAIFNLTNGNITQNTTFGNGTYTSGSAVSVGNGWWRLSITGIADTSGTQAQLLFILTSDEDGSVATPSTNDATDGIYLWGAQLEESSTVGQYVKTTTAINSAPRFDHNPTTGESLGLLVEESRTNLIGSSNTFSTAAATQTVDADVAPDGTTTAVEIVSAGGGAFKASIPVTNGSTVTYSVFLKAVSGSNILTSVGFERFGVTTINGSVKVNLNDATLSNIGSDVVSSSIKEYGNGWYRVSVTATAVDSTANIINYSNAIPCTFLVWGMQMETGSFPTSYIPTEGSTVTRSPDVTSIEGNDFGTFNLLDYSENFEKWNKINSQVTPNQAVAPDGTMSADFVSAVTTGTVRISNPTTVTAGTDYTASIYLKAGTETTCFWREDTEDALSVIVDLSAGTIYVSNGSGTITDAGNGWYRVTLTGSVSGSSFSPEIRMTSASGGLYVWGAQLEQSSTATPYVKSDVTWTSRASNATYYDYTGTLRKSSYNYVTNSNTNVEFSNGGAPNTWTSGETAPDGTATAKICTTNNRAFLDYFASGTANKLITYSVYLKATSSISLQLQLKQFNSDVIITNIPSIQLTTEWQRFEITGTSNFGGARIEILGGIQNISAWGAQLETGPYAGDYAKTTSSAASSARNVAFLPDGSGNFVSAGELLLEDAGTNIHGNNSENFRGSGSFSGDRLHWDATNTEVTAPDGQSTVFKAYFDGTETTPGGGVYVFGANTGSNYQTTNTHTSSVWIKPVLETSFNFRAHSQYASATAGGIGTNINFLFDLTGNGSVTSIETGGIDASVEKHPNGWYRLSITYHRNSTVSASTYYSVILFTQNYTSYNANSENGTLFYLWGPQVEESNYPTSYIPTYGSTATRAADVSSSSSNTFGNSFYNQTEGTVFAETEKPTLANTVVTSISDGTSSNRIELRSSSGGVGQVRFEIVESGSAGYSKTFNADSAYKKLVLAYAENNSRGVANGILGTEGTSVAIPTVNNLYFGNNLFLTDQRPGHIKRVTIWPTRLSNDTLQTITV